MAFWPPRRLWITLRCWRRPEQFELGDALARLAEAEHDVELHRQLVYSLVLGLPRRRLPRDERVLLDQILKGDDR
jgi:hypothetical protein